MSGVLRRGSLSFDVDNRSKRGSIESNLYGGYRDKKVPRTPEISVISFDFRRHSQDLKKDSSEVSYGTEQVQKNLSEDVDSDIISNYIGHYGKWNFIWTFILSLFQVTPTFQMFAFVFQVLSFTSAYKGLTAIYSPHILFLLGLLIVLRQID